MPKGQISFNGFKFGTFIGLFVSDGAASMAVKGLRQNGQHLKGAPDDIIMRPKGSEQGQSVLLRPEFTGIVSDLVNFRNLGIYPARDLRQGVTPLGKV